MVKLSSAVLVNDESPPSLLFHGYILVTLQLLLCSEHRLLVPFGEHLYGSTFRRLGKSYSQSHFSKQNSLV